MTLPRFRRVARTAALATFLASGPLHAVAADIDELFIAIRNDNTGSLRSLLQRGIDPNTRNGRGQPGLVVAMQEKSPKAVKVLLDQPGIDIDALNAAGESALMIAALKGDLADVKLLLDRGAKVNQAGWSPLHYAATGPEVAIVKLLLDRGALIDAPSPNGSTPLMLAAQYGSEDNVKLLLARGADAGLRNQKDLTAVDFARLGGRDFIVKRLESPAH